MFNIKAKFCKRIIAMEEQEDKYEVQAMDEEQAKAMFALGDEALEKMELKDLANLQLAVDKNPNGFTDDERKQLKDTAWKTIKSVAKGNRKLDAKETKSFRSMLDHVPATTFMESGKELKTFKKAEQKWFDTDRGIEKTNKWKKVARVAGRIAVKPIVWGYKLGKATAKGAKKGYQKIKAHYEAKRSAIAQDAKKAEKQAKRNQSKLSPEQVLANWALIGRGESDGRYNMAKYSENILDAAMKGEIKIDKSNAAQMAAWLEVNRDIQDRINHNNVTEKNERNKAIATQLEQFGYENPYKTKETQEQDAQTQTPPTPDKPLEQEAQTQIPPTPDKPKEVQPLTEEQSKLVQTQLGILQQFGQENGLKPEDKLYGDLAGLMEKGFAEKGITPEQMEVIRQQNPNLFPPKEQDNTQKPSENTQQPNTQQPNTQKPSENTAQTPDPNNPESFNFAALTGNEGVSGMDENKGNKAQEALAARRQNRTPEEIAKRKEMREARKVLMAQGRLRAKPKPVKTVELDTNTRNAALDEFRQRA